MSNRTWCCIPCRKAYRRIQSISEVLCPHCRAPCQYVHWRLRIPPASRADRWDEFWRQFENETIQLAAYNSQQLPLDEDLRLPLLNITLPARPSKGDPGPPGKTQWKAAQLKAKNR